MNLRPYTLSDADVVVELSLLAWAPVFASFEQVMGSAVFKRVYPNWKPSQSEAVLELCGSAKMETWVAEVDGKVVGFILWELNHEEQAGEVHMLAVHPGAQRQGVATALNNLALIRMKEAGMTLAQLMTGGDPGHEPARRSYESVGYTSLPLVRYYKVL